jgi:hypothetical protein
LSGKVVDRGDLTSVSEYGALDLLERDLEEVGKPENVVDRGASHSADLPAFDGSRAEADELSDPGSRVSGRLASILQQPPQRGAVVLRCGR